MSHYIYYHTGQKPPEYLLDSIQSIKNVEIKANISLITDQNIMIDDFINKSKELAITPWQKAKLKDFENSLIKRYEDISNKNR